MFLGVYPGVNGFAEGDFFVDEQRVDGVSGERTSGDAWCFADWDADAPIP